MKEAETQLAADSIDAGKQSAVKAAQKKVNMARAGVSVRQVTPNRMRAWGFFSKPKDASAIGSAIGPGEIYRIIHEFADLTPTEAALQNIPPELIENPYIYWLVSKFPINPHKNRKTNCSARSWALPNQR